MTPWWLNAIVLVAALCLARSWYHVGDSHGWQRGFREACERRAKLDRELSDEQAAIVTRRRAELQEDVDRHQREAAARWQGVHEALQLATSAADARRNALLFGDDRGGGSVH